MDSVPVASCMDASFTFRGRTSPVTSTISLLSAPEQISATVVLCGEGKCAVAKMAKPGETAVSKDEAMAHGFSATQVAAWDKNNDGKLDNAELTAMHAAMDKKGKEGSCSADKKGKEGSCGGDKH